MFAGEHLHAGLNIRLLMGMRSPGHMFFVLQVKGRGFEEVKPATRQTWSAARVLVHAAADQPMANFGRVAFTGLALDGSPQTEYEMVTAGGEARATTSDLANRSFTVTWDHT